MILFLIWTSGSGGMALKGISYLELWQLFCSAERNHLVILVGGVKRNNAINYFEYGSVVQEEMSYKRFLSGALAAFLFGGVEPFMQFERGHHVEY